MRLEEMIHDPKHPLVTLKRMVAKGDVPDLLLVGPPGTGKTQTNSNKIRECIEQGIDPDRIACVSFTRKAAQESRERVCGDWGLNEKALP